MNKKLLFLLVCLVFSSALKSNAATYIVLNTNDTGVGSLRQAILDANANAGEDVIEFNIPGIGVQTIAISSQLSISEGVSIDGTTQTGYDGTTPLIIVKLNGNYALTANGVTNLTFKAISTFQSTNGINLTNCNNTVINACSLYGSTAVNVAGGSDLTITDSYFEGGSDGSFALALSSITENLIPNGLSISNTNFESCVKSISMNNLPDGMIISDGSVANTHIALNDTIGSARAGLHFQSMVDVHVSKVVLGNGAYPSSTGFYFNNCSGLLLEDVNTQAQYVTGVQLINCTNPTIQNSFIQGQIGLTASEVEDITVTNVDFGTSGSDNGYALSLSSITSNAIDNGLIVTDCNFEQAVSSIYVSNVPEGLVISDGSVANTNILLSDTIGSKTNGIRVLGTDNVHISGVVLGVGTYPSSTGFYFNNCTNSLLENVNTQAQYVTGAQFVNCITPTIQNSFIQGQIGVSASDVEDLTVSNVDFGFSGAINAYTIYLNNVTASTIDKGVSISNCDFSNVRSGVSLNNLEAGIIVSDGSVPNTNIELDSLTISQVGIYGSNTDTLTIKNVYMKGASNGIQLNSCDSVVIDNVSLFSSSTRGIEVQNSTSITIKNSDLSSSASGVWLNNNTDAILDSVNFNLTGNSFAFALNVTTPSASSTEKGIVIRNCDFSESNGGIELANLLDSTIISGSDNLNAHIQILDGQLGAAQNRGIYVSNSKYIIISDIEMAASGSKNGVELASCDSIQVTNVIANNRNIGLQYNGGKLIEIDGSCFNNCQIGVYNIAESAVSVLNTMLANCTTGIQNNNGDVTVSATNNWWGANDGSVTDGGSGSKYVGNVDATNFLTVSPGCPCLRKAGVQEVTFDSPFCKFENAALTLPSSESGLVYVFVNALAGDSITNVESGNDTELEFTTVDLTETITIDLQASVNDVYSTCLFVYEDIAVLEVVDINTAVSVSGDKATAELAGQSYQWLDCNNSDLPILGATDQDYVAAEDKTVAVEITEGDYGCKDTSACVLIDVVTGMNSAFITGQASIYPMPSNGEVMIQTSFDATIEVLDFLGVQVYEAEMKAGVHPLTLTTGVYVVQLKDENNRLSSSKIVIQ